MQTKEIVKDLFSEEEMMLFGREVASQFASPNLVLALKGDLGAGKTTFLKGFISALTGTPPHLIQSPTFTYLQLYEGSPYDLYHFDLYRLKNDRQFETAGFRDYLQTGGICCLEWADRIESQLPTTTLFLEISYAGPLQRHCRLYRKGAS